MNLKSLKTAAEIKAALKPHVDAEVMIVSHDNVIKELAIGNVVVTLGESYQSCLKVSIVEPHDTADRHLLHGSISGLRVREFFETAFAAEERRNELVGEVNRKAAELMITKCSVYVDDTGKVLRLVDPVSPVDFNDDIPF